MGILISLPAITYAINKLVKLNQEINGQWFTYLCALTQLWFRRRRNKTNRIMKHQIWDNDVRHSGIIPFEHEWEYDLPSKVSFTVIFR